jgi:hypothetical protein
MPQIPSIPRLPGLPDPLRRVLAPADLESVTTIGEEDDPAAGGIDAAAAGRIWRG